MAPIVTLTMNPALDKSTSTHFVTPEDKLRCEALKVEAGGGGVNVSRAIQKLGGQSLLLHLSGGRNGQALQDILRAEQLNEQGLPVANETRESFTVLEEATTHQYRFTIPGPEVRQEEWQWVLAELAALDPVPDYLVASGSLPLGVPDDYYLRVAATLAGKPTRVIVDTSGAALRSLTDDRHAPIYLIKPNLRELGELVGQKLQHDTDIVDAALGLLSRTKIEVIVVSLGAAGVMLVSDEFNAQLRSPTVPIVSKIGAGDSTVAGITLGLSRGLNLLDAVRFGVAAGAAAVMTPGTELCRREDTEQLFNQLQNEPIITR